MSDDEKMWRAKVGAWLHDPPEKALVLLRGKGHEEGTTRSILGDLFQTPGLPADIEDAVRTADRWAAAADRPERPRSEGGYRAVWDLVTFAAKPVLRHPLSGVALDLGTLQGVLPEHVEEVSTDHLRQLLPAGAPAGADDWRRRLLLLWRRAPESPAPLLGALWRLLPADSRVPDHSIWEHVALASAFAGVLASGRTPALLSVTLGPVQAFIEQSRSTSDLWAGSHLLSSMAWEAMRVVCERYGPDAVVMPSLRGVPCVDLWLEHAQGVDVGDAKWKHGQSDSNPLFTAALPNRFLAIVAAEDAELPDAISRSVREWAEDRAAQAWRRILEKTGHQGPGHAERQLAEQLAEFPEVHWARVPWSLARPHAERGADVTALRAALGALYPDAAGEHPGFLGGALWQLLSGGVALEGGAFWRPNPGTLYPALYDAVERAGAAARATRRFAQLRQEGYRCTLCGEREWLALEGGAVQHPPGREDPVWTALASAHPSLARAGERLCGVCTLKRLWPALFVEQVRDRADLKDMQRFTVSTRTMALVPALERLAQVGGASEELAREYRELELRDLDRAALPPRLARCPEPSKELRQLPDALDRLAERPDTAERDRERLERTVRKLIGFPPDAYYALVLMDGDRLGAWLSSSGDAVGRPAYGELWHPEVATAVTDEFPSLKDYLASRAAPSPAYHASLSGVLNDLALSLVPAVVERAFSGKVLYAGGDDLLAMAPVRDLVPMMRALRAIFSGAAVPGVAEDLRARLDSPFELAKGHVLLGRELFRAMGERATCSIGAVVAHQAAPLGGVLRDLRAAEKRAKDAGRDAFSITLAKRAGGTTHLTCPWKLTEEPSPVAVLGRLVDVLRSGVLSRRFAYHLIERLEGLPDGPVEGMVKTLVAYQLGRQSDGKLPEADVEHLSTALDALTLVAAPAGGEGGTRIGWLQHFIRHAEFLARAQRGHVKGKEREE